MRSGQNISVENRERKRALATPRVEVKIILKQILKKYDVTMWTALNRLRISDSLLSAVNIASRATRSREFLE
jgi:hypothetical protein